MSKRLKAGLWGVALLLGCLQAFFYFLEDMSDYIVIYGWVIYGVNYLILLIIFIAFTPHRIFKWVQWSVAFILLIMNSVFFYQQESTVHLIVSESKDQKHEVLFEENEHSGEKTVRLERRGLIFGRKLTMLDGSATYKTFAQNTAQIKWINGDTALLTYKEKKNGQTYQQFISFRPSVGYHHIAVSLSGTWIDKDHPQNQWTYDRGEIAFRMDGTIYHYNDSQDTEQLGIYGFKVFGDYLKPSYTVVLNEDSTIGQDDLIADGGTFTLCFTNGRCEVYAKAKR
ncbi:hypothetical protein GCM10011391_06010 [Pullulanibacillus camelliae]|uniref:Lipoprotein n=1 Tax=Pullulanibacillus camelliae TaxID=1707096 RepID=A0A8J2VLM3_9BACL|nr:hypothetical protein [Pullulanibacillus camelliae]GGE30223.1 hypothetical protein GCM10011391_06010 [Pullulanibacillus camelliae]